MKKVQAQLCGTALFTPAMRAGEAIAGAFVWSAFCCFALGWPGFRPGGRPSSLLRQRRRQERRPGFPGRSLRERLPCAARIGRPARNSSAAPPQTAAPEGPARCCSAGRNGLFANTACLLKQGAMINAKAKPQGLASAGFSAEARCLLKARSDPPSSGTAGGEVRRGCLSPQGEFRVGRLA